MQDAEGDGTPGYRWVLPANQRVKVDVAFQSSDVGAAKSSLAFEVSHAWFGPRPPRVSLQVQYCCRLCPRTALRVPSAKVIRPERSV